MATILGESANPVILSAAKDLPATSGDEILRCAQNDIRLHRVCQENLPDPNNPQQSRLPTICNRTGYKTENAPTLPRRYVDSRSSRIGSRRGNMRWITNNTTR